MNYLKVCQTVLETKQQQKTNNKQQTSKNIILTYVLLALLPTTSTTYYCRCYYYVTLLKLLLLRLLLRLIKIVSNMLCRMATTAPTHLLYYCYDCRVASSCLFSLCAF